jgi:hypothetical protein
MDSEQVNNVKKGYDKERKRAMMRLYFENHKNDRKICEICDKEYATFNKYNHLKSKFHKSVDLILKKKQLI